MPDHLLYRPKFLSDIRHLSFNTSRLSWITKLQANYGERSDDHSGPWQRAIVAGIYDQPHKSSESYWHKCLPDTTIIGVDEVGRGALAGPLVTAAVSLDMAKFSALSGAEKALIKDSKALTPQQRESARCVILEVSSGLDICFISAVKVDDLGLSGAVHQAMISSCTRVLGIHADQIHANKIHADKIHADKTHHPSLPRAPITTPTVPIHEQTRPPETSHSDITPQPAGLSPLALVIVDGPNRIKSLNLPQLPVLRAENSFYCVAAASILAKCSRDRYMRELSLNPGLEKYHFDRHKGYGTRVHIKALEEHGPCREHRRSFGPVSKCLHS